MSCMLGVGVRLSASGKTWAGFIGSCDRWLLDFGLEMDWTPTDRIMEHWVIG